MDLNNKRVQGGRPSFFENPETDRLLAIIVRLLTEHSVLSERLKALETLLERQGALDASVLAQFEPSPEQTDEWAMERLALIKNVLESGANITSNE